jgi:hypothetical protein
MNVRKIDSSEEEECVKPQSMSTVPTQWFQCIACSKWSHDRSSSFSDFCVRSNCKSDDDSGDLKSVD